MKLARWLPFLAAMAGIGYLAGAAMRQPPAPPAHRARVESPARFKGPAFPLPGLDEQLEDFGAWDRSGARPRRAPDGGCDPRCQHDQAVRDMERLMNSGF